MIKKYNDIIKESKVNLVDGGYYWVKFTNPQSRQDWTVGKFRKCDDVDDLCLDVVGSD